MKQINKHHFDYHATEPDHHKQNPAKGVIH